MRGRKLFAGVVAALAVGASGAAPAAALDPLTVSGGKLKDRHGRNVVLHGINVHYKVAPYLPHDGSLSMS